jgi:hypothetical protein
MSHLDSRSQGTFHAGTAHLRPHPAGVRHRITVMSKSEKQNLRYVDYYCFMSLAEFTAWLQEDGDDEPYTSWSSGR